MHRREFILLLAGTTIGWPLAARAQQSQQTRIVGVLANGLEADGETKARLAAFGKALKDLGWSPGTNLRIETRYGIDDDVLLKARGNWAGLLRT